MSLPFDPRNQELSEICKKLVAQRYSGELDQGELEKELCYVSIKYCMDDLKPKPFPRPPEVLDVLSSMDKQQKISFQKNNPDLFKRGDVWEWSSHRDSIEDDNARNKEWLKKMVSTFNLLGDTKNEEVAYFYLQTHGVK